MAIPAIGPLEALIVALPGTVFGATFALGRSTHRLLGFWAYFSWLMATVLARVDPFDGWLFVLPGAAIVVLGAFLGNASRRMFLFWTFLLVAVGVVAASGYAGAGGVPGRRATSPSYALVLVPYIAGWMTMMVGAAHTFFDAFRPPSHERN
jgi:hypothetical protein